MKKTDRDKKGKSADKKLKIGEFAGALGMNASQVRYYEKLELIGRTHDERSGYRQYAPSDSLDLINMKTLRGFGLSLKDARHILEDHKDSDQIWIRHIADLDRQIQRLQAARDVSLYYLRNSADDTGPCLEHREALYFLQMGTWGTFDADEAYNEIIKEWITHMPEAGYWGIFDAVRFRGCHCEELLSGFSILERCVRREHVFVPEKAVRVPEGTYLKWFYDGTFHDFWKPEKLEEAYLWAERNGYTPEGTGVWHFLRNRRCEDRQVLRYILYFPVQKRPENKILTLKPL